MLTECAKFTVCSFVKEKDKIKSKKYAGIARILWKIVYKHWGVLVKGMERSLKI